MKAALSFLAGAALVAGLWLFIPASQPRNPLGTAVVVRWEPNQQDTVAYEAEGQSMTISFQRREDCDAFAGRLSEYLTRTAKAKNWRLAQP